jgi:cephalosporin hydroxylase
LQIAAGKGVNTFNQPLVDGQNSIMNPHEKFQAEVNANLEALSQDKDVQALSRIWVREISPYKWAYNFSWLGRPAIQFPNDAWAVQELIWSIKPDLIIETGIAHGGSLMFSASMLGLLEMCEAAEAGKTLDPRKPSRKVLGIDIDIRAHNRAAIEAHPMRHRIEMIQGSSIAPEIIKQVHELAGQYKKILVLLDSNHTHNHVLAELEAYAPLTSKGSYCVVFDTLVEDMPKALSGDRPWAPGDSPKTAVLAYLKALRESSQTGVDGTDLQFEIDKKIDAKLQISVAPEGYLRRL